MKNERNAGRKPIFKTTDTKILRKTVPVKAYKEISDAFDKMIKEQFADRDWT